MERASSVVLMIFETDRLRVRKLSVNELDVFHRIHGDRELMGSIPSPVLTLDESRAELNSIVSTYANPDHRLRVWGAFLRRSHVCVGVCASVREFVHCRDIGYRILREYWGRGTVLS